MKDNRVIFVCFTPYQFFNALYYAMRVDWKGYERVLIWSDMAAYGLNLNLFEDYFDAILEIECYAKERFLPRQFKRALYGGRLFSLSRIGRFIRKQKKNNLLICFSDEEIVTHRIIDELKGDSSNSAVLVEEGMNTYLIMDKPKRSIHSRVLDCLLGLRTEPYIGANPFISSVIVKNPDLLPGVKCNNRVVIKQNSIFADGEWIKNLKSIGDSIERILDIPPHKKVLLWIGQPLDGDGVDATDEIRLITQISENLKDAVLLVKRHPRETLEKYQPLRGIENIRIIELEDYSWIPLELLYKFILPSILISAFSSAALNALELGFDVTVVFCYRLLGMSIDEHYFASVKKKSGVYDVDRFETMLQIIQSQTEAKRQAPFLNTNEDIHYLGKLRRL